VALRKVGVPAWLGVVGCVVLLAAGSAVAAGSSPPPPTVTVDSVRFSGTWHEGWFGIWRRRVVHHLGRSDVVWKRVGNGSLIVAGAVSAGAKLDVSLRSSSGKVISTSTPFSAPAGRYRASLKLGRPLPGLYTVTTRVVGPSDTTLKAVHKQVNFPPPLEGVADRASIGSSRTGPGVKVLHNRHVAWARFHFLTKPPHTSTVYIEWRQPNWVHVCQTPNGPAPHCRLEKRPIPANGFVYTFLRSSAKLQTGRWYCQMSVKNGSRYIVARRTFVTIR
jgi:hypothetical protein